MRRRWLKVFVGPQLWLSVFAIFIVVSGVLFLPSAAPTEPGRATQKPSNPTGAVDPKIEVVNSPDCNEVKCIALTFDDGPNYLTTPKIIASLKKYHVPASFFVVGSRVAGQEWILRDMYQNGDEIGNHSWNHPNFTKLSAAQIKNQINDTQRAIIAAGVPAPTLFRPPYGAVNAKVRANVPLTIMFWNEDPTDWANESSAQVVQSVVKSARPGGVIDMHDIYETTVEAVPPIIQKLESEHYHFVTVSQLLGLRSGQPGEYYGRK